MGGKVEQRRWRKDYRPPDHQVDEVELDFDLYPDHAGVAARLHVRRATTAAAGAPLRLHGEGLELLALRVDGRPIAKSAWCLRADGGLDVDLGGADRAVVETEVMIRPHANSALSGLYMSGDMFLTQCEAEGFRRITFFPDRPDVMARFRVRVAADRASCPVLLSNGDRVSAAELPEGRHCAVFHDPFPKPCYLFALVAGALRDLHEPFVTRSGRTVDLHLWSAPENLPRLAWAMDCLKRAMRWDEETFGLEYDLATFHVVATRDFNMGAMENKGLNIFNATYLLASPETATDEDHELVEGVVAHEYFHNWTGNRVTCRDWFQLTLKEGLTVYRDQRFSSEVRSAAIKRIEDVRMLRARQFPEDSGPLAHPIRPEAYEAMDNFYTATVYLKGSEVVRLYETLLGKEGFRRGMDLYFRRHDGGAVACDDFRAAMADANGRDLAAFERWYLQAGTPVVEAAGRWDASARRYSLRLRQRTPETPGQPRKNPQPIPVAVGLLARDGRELVPTRVLLLESTEQEFSFEEVATEPVPSLLRGFSAPVRLLHEQSDADLALLLAHDTDSFNRWESGQRLAARVLLGQVSDLQRQRAPRAPQALADAWRTLLASQALDSSLAAATLTLPDEEVLADEMTPPDPASLRAARLHTEAFLAHALLPALETRLHAYHRAGPYAPTPEQIGPRRLRNRCLDLLVAGGGGAARAAALAQWQAADNLSDARGALAALCRHVSPERDAALADARRRWQPDPALLDKWFQVQASACAADTPQRVRALTADPDFMLRNPNRVMSLLRAFARNYGSFHSADGDGYALLADHILALDPINPSLAAGLAKTLASWRRHAAPLAQRMHEQLLRIAAAPAPSKNLSEIVRLALADLQSVPA
jgi:aminopeptidase N